MMKKIMTLCMMLSFVVLISNASDAKGLPKVFGVTAFGTTSAGYASMVSIGDAISEDGYKLRVLPAKNDISRMLPLRAGKVEFTAQGVGIYLCQEGVFDFADAKWGPQPVRLLMLCWGKANQVAATAKEANIMKPSDLKGKRVAWVIGGPALNQNFTGMLAFANLTWNDVIKVKVPGWGASAKGLIDGTIDASMGRTNSSKYYELAGSPRGLRFLRLPHDDKEGWKRMRKYAPWLVPQMATVGVGLSEENPHEGGTFGYPILATYPDMDSLAVYEMTKLLDTKFEKYKDSGSTTPGWAMDKQVFDWIIPYHKGAVKYFKEIGVWNSKFQEHNDHLLKRQRVLVEAWQKAKAEKKGKDGWEEFWMKKRRDALKSEGMEPVF
jgi:TRAP transporter TAXI family solute receptor